MNNNDVFNEIRTEPTLSPPKAVLWGHLLVTVPALSAAATGIAVSFGWYGGRLPGLFYTFVGLSVAQLWVSIVSRYWLAWVRRSGVDQEHTKTLAQRARLISRKRFLQIESDGSTGRVRRILRLFARPVMTLAVGLVLWLYLGPIAALVYAKQLGRTHPEVWVVPMPLPKLPAEKWAGRKFTYFGYEFETPWTELKQERQQESMVILNFTNNAAVALFDPAQRRSERDGSELFEGISAHVGVDISTILGEQEVGTSYESLSKALYLTPSDAALSLSRSKMTGDSLRLIWKVINTNRPRGGLYSFQTTWLRGFQIGNPSVDSPTVLIAFDAKGQKCELWIASGATRVTQADISGILSSLHPVQKSQ